MKMRSVIVTGFEKRRIGRAVKYPRFEKMQETTQPLRYVISFSFCGPSCSSSRCSNLLIWVSSPSILALAMRRKKKVFRSAISRNPRRAKAIDRRPCCLQCLFLISASAAPGPFPVTYEDGANFLLANPTTVQCKRPKCARCRLERGKGCQLNPNLKQQTSSGNFQA